MAAVLLHTLKGVVGTALDIARTERAHMFHCCITSRSKPRSRNSKQQQHQGNRTNVDPLRRVIESS
jgi:hypothetical protein